MGRVYISLTIIILLAGCTPFLTPDYDSIQTRADAEYLAGNFKQAISLYEQFLAKNPPQDKVSNAQYRIGLCNIKLGEPEKAITYLDKALNNSSDGVLRLMVQEGLAYSYNMLGQPARAITYLENINQAPISTVERAVKRDDLFYNMGITYIRKLDWEKGRLMLKRLLLEFPGSERRANAEAVLAVKQDKFFIRFGYFQQKANAENMVKELGEKNISSSIIEIQGKAFMVVSAGYRTWQEANKELQQLREKGFDVTIIP